jgi:hypothetical protein
VLSILPIHEEPRRFNAPRMMIQRSQTEIVCGCFLLARKQRTMPNFNPNCDGAHCRPGYREVRLYPLGSADNLYLCLPCFANANMRRLQRAKETGRPEDWPQVSWVTAEVAFDKHGEPFDAEAALRQEIINYHQNGNNDE